MKVRIKFEAEVYIEGKDMGEVARKWQWMPILSEYAVENASGDFCGIVSVEDAETYEDLSVEFNENT